DLQEALVVGRQTARWAPAHRRTGGELARYQRTIEHVDLVNRETRVLIRDVARFVRSGRAAPPALVESIHDLARALWELPAQFEEPWRSGDVLVLALGAAGRATAAAESGDAAVGQVAGHVRSVAIDVVRASEAVDAAGGAIAEARTDEYVALPPRAPREPPPAGGEHDLAANG
ncbi:MAG TPA: hypothetical protein VLB47_08515, partial [Solirubrobacteraceae bacterium]|nr:hypothetical protein [Solirubrobacteraceae bacterium]